MSNNFKKFVKFSFSVPHIHTNIHECQTKLIPQPHIKPTTIFLSASSAGNPVQLTSTPAPLR